MRLATTRALIQAMGDHGLQTWEREPAPAHGAIPPAISHPHDVVGPLGAMTIYPDGYTGAKPHDAIDEQTYARMLEVYGHIDSGHSQLQLDSSSCFRELDGQPIDPLAHPLEYAQGIVRAAQFRAQTMGYLRDLVKTPAGLVLLSQLDGSRHTTTLAASLGTDGAEAADDREAHRDPFGVPGTGSDATVGFDINEGTCMTDACRAHEAWTRDGSRYDLYNGLVHAYHFTRGDAANGRDGRDRDGNSIASDDWQAAGLGPEAWQPVSENRIRSQMHAPLRPSVADVTYEGAHRK